MRRVEWSGSMGFARAYIAITGEAARCRTLLAAALATAAARMERPALAAAVDAIAVFALGPSGKFQGWSVPLA